MHLIHYISQHAVNQMFTRKFSGTLLLDLHPGTEPAWELALMLDTCFYQRHKAGCRLEEVYYQRSTL